MRAAEVKALIGKEKIVPILRTNSANELLDIAGAVVESGMKILEFTMTIPNVIDALPKIKSKYPELILGMGTVVRPEDAKNALNNGIDFIVSHILAIDIVDTVKKEDKMLMLAAFTPTEIHNAHKIGSDIVKLFPANVVDPRFIKSIHGPMPKVDLLPTGGLDLIAAIRFLKAGAYAVGMGGSIFKKSWIKSGNYNAISTSLKNACHRIQNMEL